MIIIINPSWKLGRNPVLAESNAVLVIEAEIGCGNGSLAGMAGAGGIAIQAAAMVRLAGTAGSYRQSR
jgi:hypothetical protein